MTPEKQVQNKILDYLKKLQKSKKGIFFERRQAGGFSYKKGIPDIYIVYKGLHIEVEVKSKTGQQSVMQEKFEQMCIENNITYLLINDIDDFIKKFTSLCYTREIEIHNVI